MILPDVNLLIYAYNSDSPFHDGARRWWEAALEGTEPVGLAWITIMAYVRITTHDRVFQTPLPLKTSIRHVRSWLKRPNVQLLTSGEFHGDRFFAFLEEIGTAGNLTTDAHLAALAIEYRATLATTDRDFARFKGLRWINPLEHLAR